MTEITLQAVRAKQIELSTEQTKLNAMVAALLAQVCTTITVDAFDVGLRDGEHYAGAVLNEDGSVKHHLVLMAAKPDATLAWPTPHATVASLSMLI